MPNSVQSRLKRASPVEAVPREAVPHQRDGSFIAVARNQFGDRMAAHPDGSVLAVGVAEHGLGRDDAFESVVHAPRSLTSRAIAARSSAIPAPLWAEVASTSGWAAGCLASAAAVAARSAASSASFTWSALVSTTW